MLDVIHYVFEEDQIVGLVENPAEARSKIRSQIYRLLYEREYRHTVTESGADVDGGGSDQELKPYIPPTDPENFSKVLGAPMGE